jgi:hypothetical protein
MISTSLSLSLYPPIIKFSGLSGVTISTSLSLSLSTCYVYLPHITSLGGFTLR